MATEKLKRFLAVSSKFTKPGFSQFLGTDALTLSKTYKYNKHSSFNVLQSQSQTESQKSRSEWDDKTKRKDKQKGPASYSFRYKIPSHACVSVNTNVSDNPHLRRNSTRSHSNSTTLPSSTSSSTTFLPLSGYLAIFDDFTTLALIDEDRKTRPGLSLSLSAQLGPHSSCSNSSNHEPSRSRSRSRRMPSAGANVDIDVRVTKIGNIFGFAEAKAICCDSGRIIASGKHVKYLPAGPWFHELLLGPYLLPLTAWVSSQLELGQETKVKNTDKEGMVKGDSGRPQRTMDEALSVQRNDSSDEGNVNFLVKGHHCNPYGSLHGGCQAMLMESVGNKFMLRNDSNSNYNESNSDSQSYKCTHTLESIHVTYKTQGKNNVSFETEVNEPSYEKSSSIGLNIKVVNAKGTVISEGALRYEREPK